MLKSFLEGRVIIKTGDITREKTDAIVNAANSSLLGGSGVDGAIHAAGGSDIDDECLRIRQTQYPDGLPTGEAVITTAGRLPAKFVIHTVGPIYGENDGRDAELLARCYASSIAVAIENSLSTIAFPAISTGVYRFPKDEAARVASHAISAALSANPTVTAVNLVFYRLPDAEAFLSNCRF